MALTQLVTAQEVIDRVITNKKTDTLLINSHIHFSELEFIRPHLGQKLYEDLLANNTDTENAALITPWIKDTLSHYVKFRALPDMMLQTSSQGIMINNPSPFSASSTVKERKELREIALGQAQSLMRDTLQFINDNISDYPLFTSISNNCN